MRREMHDAVICEPTGGAQRLQLAFGGPRAESDFVHIGLEATCHRTQLIGGVSNGD